MNKSKPTLEKVNKDNIKLNKTKFIKKVQKDISKTENTNNPKSKYKVKETSSDKMFVVPLGGIEEIGKNMTFMQYKDEIIIIDAGATFPDETLPGIDLVIPDFSFLANNKNKIKGLFLTHGHEDHIGAIPYLYEKIGTDVPIYGGKLTLALVKSKFENVGISKQLPKFIEIKGREQVKVGKYFSVEFISVTHSIADSYCISVKTPAAHVFHTGDFKIDLTPVDGDGVDFARLAELGDEGVDLMLSDSTNAEVEGFTPSERKVGEVLKDEFFRAQGRIIVAVFASHIHRIQQILDIAKFYGKKVAVDGRSLVKVFEIAPNVDCMHIPEDLIIPLNKINNYKENEILILCTGTQGEPMAALSRIANNMHKFIHVREGDTVIISATPIPGNERAASSNINNLLKLNANVIFKRVAGIHVSGHGSKEEQKLMLSLIKPKNFMPVHGEHRMLKAHEQTAIETGVLKENVFITQNGTKLELSNNKVKVNGKLTVGSTLVDGLGIGDIGISVIKDRQQLSHDGIVVITYIINKDDGKIIAGPHLATKGFIYFKESEEIVHETLELLTKKISDKEVYPSKEWGILKNNIKDITAKFLYNKTKRNPLILPIILNV